MSLRRVLFRRQEEKSAEQTFKLRDGQTIRFGNDASKSAEGLFDPGIYGLEIGPTHCALHLALNKSSPHLRAELSENVVLVCRTPESNWYTF